ncbi:hypothetical protein [Anaeromyxobacter diazotrophicus]|uniref:Uncharacterized protein n=1 Tax=Anaeromyxobacter diazotrophicus TaxID=2590199 RepID=A0A7I9VRU5_9BACT|nr:hypothetical protein [Anaeromyxobacter diazotrophicus]GEJ58789.1 hypothetical protein AMYX_35300 [Anaeromyxobacter diazotrophicus]
MHPMTVAAALAALTWLTPTAGLARAPAARSGPFRLEVLDAGGRPLPAFSQGGRTYVLGALGERYLLRVRNGGPRRVEAVVSVDGRDVVDGGPAGWEKRGYLIDAGAEVTLDGFRLSRATVAAFRFSSVPRSYAALMGDARDVGVIGVAVFIERERPPRLARPLRELESRPGLAPAPRGAGSDAGASAAPGERSARRPGLGTAFGEERDSPVQLVAFERASSRPATMLSVRYDDRVGLLAAGVELDGRWTRREEARLREEAEPFRRSGGFAQPPPGWSSER